MAPPASKHKRAGSAQEIEFDLILIDLNDG